jgi:hypothetical protein
MAQFSTIKSDKIFSIYVNKIGRINTIIPTKNETYDEFDNAINFGLMLGKIKTERYGSFSASIGLSFTKGKIKQFYTNPTSSREKNFSTIGIPIKIQVGTPIKFLGLGITLLTNLNLESSTSCLMFTLNYGNLLKNK